MPQGQNIGGNLVKAYQASIPQYAQDVQQRQSRYLPVIKHYKETMAGGSSGPTSLLDDSTGFEQHPIWTIECCTLRSTLWSSLVLVWPDAEHSLKAD